MNTFGCGEAVKEGTTDTACHMLQQTGRNGHLAFHEFKEVGIGDGAIEFIGGQGAREVCLNREVEDEISPHRALLREHAVEGKYTDILQTDGEILNFQPFNISMFQPYIIHTCWLHNWYR